MLIKLIDGIFPVTERFGDQLAQILMLSFTQFTLGKVRQNIDKVLRHLAIPYRTRKENVQYILAET